MYFQDTLNEYEKKMQDLEGYLQKLKGTLKDKDGMIGKLEDKIRDQQNSRKVI